MKIIYILPVLFCVILVKVHGRTMPKLTLYLDQGIIRCRYYGYEDLGNDKVYPNYAYMGGLGIKLNFNRQYGLNTGLLYERKGVLYKKPDIGNHKNIQQLKEEFITLPILVRYGFGKRMNYYIEGGVWGAYLVAVQFAVDNYLFNTASYVPIPEYENRYSYGISAGAGVSYSYNKDWQFSLTIRDNFGLRYRTNDAHETMVLRSNSTNLMIGVGYVLKNK